MKYGWIDKKFKNMFDGSNNFLNTVCDNDFSVVRTFKTDVEMIQASNAMKAGDFALVKLESPTSWEIRVSEKQFREVYDKHGMFGTVPYPQRIKEALDNAVGNGYGDLTVLVQRGTDWSFFNVDIESGEDFLVDNIRLGEHETIKWLNKIEVSYHDGDDLILV